MPAPIKEKIRWPIVMAVEDNVPPEEVAKMFNVSKKRVERFHTQYKNTGSVTPKAMGGDRRSQKIECYHDDIMAILKEKRDRTLKEMATILFAKFGEKAKFGISTFWQFLFRHDYSRKKKTGHATEQRSPKIEQQRGNFIRKYNESVRYIFIDETGASTSMSWTHGRCKRGECSGAAYTYCTKTAINCGQDCGYIKTEK